MMLCSKGKKTDVEKYHLKGWISQEKKDGVRCLAYCDEGVKLEGRSGSVYNSKFEEIVSALSGNCVLDGEICSEDFNKTLSRVHTENKLKIKLLSKSYPAVFYVFDILFLNGVDLRGYPLIERLKILHNSVQDSEFVKKLPFTPDLVNSWVECLRNGDEGVILKKLDSKYEERRSRSWIKVKKEVTRDVVVNSYEINPAGIKVSGEDLVCQVSGSNAVLVKKEIDETGSCKIEVKGLEVTENNKIRMITFKSMKDV